MFCNTFDSLAVKKRSYYKITLLNQHMKVSAYIILLNYCNVKAGQWASWNWLIPH